jgi:hypothetical protein
MKSFLLGIVLLICSIASGQTLEIGLSTGIEDTVIETTTSYGLVDIGTKFRRVEVGGYVYYLPGVWETLPDPKPHYCFGKRPCALEEAQVDSLRSAILKELSRTDSLEKINKALWFALMQKDKQLPKTSAFKKDTGINIIHLIILLSLTLLWLLYPSIYEKIHSHSATAIDN